MEKKIKNKGKFFIIGIILVVLIFVVIMASIIMIDSKKTVEFQVLNEKKIPQEISSDVLPEYRTLERALACMVDDQVYVIVTRGEKPASGFKVEIDKMKLEKEEQKENLIVYATFKDPAKENSVSQVVNYPIKVAKTELKSLPDEIELRVQYEE